MTVLLKDIFAKDIGRHIDGVIKADDTDSLATELEEYVVTREVEKLLQKFLNAYNGGPGGTGVWISGFFGSGKSHLLKMLALLLENGDVGGRSPLSYFEQKFDGNTILLADLKRAAAIPAKSILFNIDQQANVVAKDQADALLSVFVKVFDEMQGYYGQLPYVADFERDLDEHGYLAGFRTAFERMTGEPWETKRRSAGLFAKAVSNAYTEATGNEVPSGDILKQYRDHRTLSIENFAERVNAYVKRREKTEPGFRINFFVDEVGQYIAGNSKLMLNLQTIAESLATKCRNRAWIVVTAQQEMDAIIGEMNRAQSNDFSKIMARFAERLPLNAADVAEVIQRRLLEKTDSSAVTLGEIYDDQVANLRTLFEFGDGTQTMGGFKDRGHFVRSYPFHPYQYELFQKAIRGLSEQNAFEGRHTSTGERSMLGAFQEVGRVMMDARLGDFATFDLMFEGIRSVLKATAQHAVLSAEKHLTEIDAFAVRVLKALFLVKYVEEFKSTSRNVAILMRGRLDLDPTEHKRKVEAALALLERESYVQRNGDIYEFLTNEEKDVEQKIKAIGLDATDISRELSDMLFGEIITRKAIVHEASGQSFAFSQRIHHALIGKEHTLAINLVTPYMPASERGDQMLANRSMNENELMIVLAEESWFVDELTMYLRTKRFLGRESANEHREGTADILRAKGSSNDARRRRVVQALRDRIAAADMLVRGEALDLRSSDPKVRIEQAFQALVDRVFTALAMLRGVVYRDADLDSHLETPDDGQVVEAEAEVLNKITANRKNALRSTAKGLIEAFEKPPHGWPEAATLCMIASLIGRGRLEASSSGKPLDGNDLLSALRNPTTRTNLNLDPVEAFNASEVMSLRRLFQDLFERTPVSSDGKGLGRETAEAIEEVAASVDAHMEKATNYPFVSALQPFRDALAELRAKPGSWYVSNLAGERGEAIADLKESLFDPIDTFFRGSQKDIYDDARKVLASEEANLEFVDAEVGTRVRTAIFLPDVYRGGQLQALKTDLDRLKSEIRDVVAREREAASRELQQLSDQLVGSSEFEQADESVKAEVKTVLADLRDRIIREKLVPSIRTVLTSFRRDRYPKLMQQLLQAHVKEPVLEEVGGGDGLAPEPISVVHITNLGIRFGRPLISSEADVDDYLNDVRAAMVEAVRAGKRITL